MKTKNILVIIVVTLGLLFTGCSDKSTGPAEPVNTWHMIYEPDGYYNFFSINPANDGAIVGGISDYNPFIARIGSNGEILWENKSSGDYSYVKSSTLSYGNNEYLVVSSDLTSGSHILFSRFTSDGTHLDNCLTNSGDGSVCRSFVNTFDNNIVLAGSSGRSAKLEKVNYDGALLWELTQITLAPVSGIIGLIRTSDNGYLAICESYENQIVVKADVHGNKQWETPVDLLEGFDQFRRSNKPVECAGGGYLIAGARQNLTLTKLDSQGKLLWNKQYDEIDPADGCAIVRDYDGYAITGTCFTYYENYDNDYLDIFLLKIDFSGNLLWYHKYSGYSESYFAEKKFTGEVASDICKSSDGGYLISGYVFGGGGIVIKTDHDGNVGDSVIVISD